MASIFQQKRRLRLLYFSFLLCTTSYEVWVGGDPWDYWRIMSPSMPFVIALAADLMPALAFWLGRTFRSQMALVPQAAILIMLMALLCTDFPFRSDIDVSHTSYTARLNKHNMDIAIAIDHLTTPNARIGVFLAGLIPYYTGRYSIDFLGKSDKYI